MYQERRLKLIIWLFPLIVLLVFLSCKHRREVTSGELADHISYLSSDSLKGRLAGTPGDSLAAEYIRNELASFGFEPLAGDGFQRFKVISKLSQGPDNSLSAGERSYTPGKDFMPLAITSNSGLVAGALFAGYGFNINIDSLEWNDYKNADIKGKWVILLSGDPEPDNTASLFIPFSGDRDKALAAKDLGAGGVIFVSGPSYDQEDNFESLNTGEMPVGIPVLRIKREVANYLFSKTNSTVAELEEKLNNSRKPQSFQVNLVINARAEVLREMNTTRNVAMILRGEDQNLKNEYLIIGAHLDHLGMGGTGSGSRAPDTVAIHYGADDNASGVSMMLEIAEKFASTPGSHKRSIICLAFAAEEMGLLGSKYFVENPLIDLLKVNAMINLDMVGRLPETNSVQISGVGTAEGLKRLITSASDTSLIKLMFSEGGYGLSDHSSFYRRNIPVLFYFTGISLDYHTPSDTYDKINYPGMVNLSSLIFSVAELLATSSDRLQFRETGQAEPQGRPARRRGVTLGIMPDFAGNVKNGLRADFVTPGKPADLGGMKKGDIITSINGKTVNNVYDYMSRMGQLKPGQTISVEVLRDGSRIVLLIQL